MEPLALHVDGSPANGRVVRYWSTDLLHLQREMPVPVRGWSRPGTAGADGMVRAMTRRAKENEIVRPQPRRYSVCVSTNPTGNRFESLWMDATGGLPEALGKKIHEKTGKPVGIVCMDGGDWELKQWISPEGLPAALSLKGDGGAAFGEQLSALANDWKTNFGGPDPWFFYTMPSQAPAPAVTKPQAIKGRSAGLEIVREFYE